jgi:hypothetical protein
MVFLIMGNLLMYAKYAQFCSLLDNFRYMDVTRVTDI